jgi:hypothetical protein
LAAFQKALALALEIGHNFLNSTTVLKASGGTYLTPGGSFQGLAHLFKALALLKKFCRKF